MDVVGQRGVAVHTLRTLSRVLVARTSRVDQVLDNGGVGEAESGEGETDGDTGNGTKLDAGAAEDRVDDTVEDRGEDQNRDGIEVLHEIVGHTVALHLTSLSDKVGRELAVANPEDGVEDEDLASTQGTLQLIDKVVVPVHSLGASVGLAPRRLSSVGVAGYDHHPQSLEAVRDDGTLGRAVDVGLATPDEDTDAHVENAETHQERGPEALVLFHEWCGQQTKGTEVDAPVENHVDALVGDGRVDDNTLSALLRLDSHNAALVLVGNERRNVTLDTTGAKTDDNERDDVSGLGSARIESDGQRGSPEDDETNPVEDAEDKDSLVLSEILVGNDGTENRSD